MGTSRRKSEKMLKLNRNGGGRARRRLAAVLPVFVLAMLVAAGTAHAEVEYQYNIGSSGSSGGGLNYPTGLAVNNADGHVYVADRDNNRIDELTETGAFVQAWGYDVVSSGTDD